MFFLPTPHYTSNALSFCSLFMRLSARRSSSESPLVFNLDDRDYDLRPRVHFVFEPNGPQEEETAGPLAMLSEKLGSLIQEGLVEGQRFALSSDLWRYASSTAHCDLLIILQPITDNKESATAVTRLVDIIKQHEPGLRIQVRHHRLKNCFALYLTADYKSLLKGAELCHIKKTAKPAFGGGLKEFCFEDAQCFLGIEGKNTFLTDMERTIIVKQMLDMIRAPPGGVSIDLSNRKVFIAEGMAILPRLMSANVIQSMLPLHNEQYLRHLQQKWVFTLNPTQQPLEEIKEYFGTEIAMYFSWLGHLTSTLWFPAILGLFMFFFGGFKYRPDESDHENQLFSDICFVLFAFFNCVWSTAYLESWKRKQAELAFKWGTYATGDPLLMDPRPGFQGDYMAPNPVSGRLEPFYPPWKHTVTRYCVTYPVTFLCVAFMFLAMLAIFVVQDAFDYYFGGSVLFGWICYLPMVVYALLIVVADKLYRVLALFLNELENYRTEDEYEDFLISKIVIFQSVTAFGSLFYIAFVIHDMRRLQETLATLLITRQITQKIKDTAVPFIMERVKLSQLTYKLTKSMSEGTLRKHVEQVRKKRESTPPPSPKASFTLGSPTEEGPRRRFSRITTQGNQHLLDLLENFHSETTSPRSPRLPIPEFQPSPDGPELNQAELESLMTVYARPLDDYLEIFIQFGYVLLFSPAFPLAALCALVNNLVEIRADAFKLSNTVQRPFARQVKDIGAWQKAMQVLGVAGVMVNCALIGQSGLVHRLWPDLTWGGQMLLVVLLEHLILAAKFFIDIVVPDIPHWIRIESAKQEHHRREAFKRESRIGRNSSQNEGTPPPVSLARSGKRRSMTPMLRLSTLSREYSPN